MLQGGQRQPAEVLVGVAARKAFSQQGLDCPEVAPLLHLVLDLPVSAVQALAGAGLQQASCDKQ